MTPPQPKRPKPQPVVVPERGPDDLSRAEQIRVALTERYPGARIELDYGDALQLLIAAVLSAQTTDERVNTVTPELFARYRSAADYAEADPAELEKIIASLGYFRQKTQAVIKVATVLVERHDGEVPRTLDELVAIPWVGRKTANFVLGNVFDVPGVAVDTHVSKVAQRLGWSTTRDPAQIEADVASLYPAEHWAAVTRVLIVHGRRTCHARKPACGACPVAELCPSFGLAGKGETDPLKAAALVAAPA